MFNIIPAFTSVSVDNATGRPREIRTDGQRLAVTGLESVRDETSAYPLDSGPVSYTHLTLPTIQL